MKKTTYEICWLILRNAAIQYAQAVTYPWSDQFVRDEMRELQKKILESSWFEPINPSLLTKEQMEQLMFNMWSNRENLNIMLIPLYLRPYIKPEITVYCIDGKSAVYDLDKIDDDHRYGCMAYGVVPATEEEK